MPWIADVLFSMGHEWVRATNQKEAQTHFLHHDFDYVLLDTSIPARSRRGVTSTLYAVNLLKWIRRTEGSGVPVIVMTGDSREQVGVVVRFMRAEADDIVPKPCLDGGQSLLTAIGDTIENAESEICHNAAPMAEADEDSSGWLTVSEAARLLMDVVSNLTLAKARSRISTAARRGEFVTNGKHRKERRIELDSFNTWRFKQRDRDLATADDEW